MEATAEARRLAVMCDTELEPSPYTMLLGHLVNSLQLEGTEAHCSILQLFCNFEAVLC